MTRRTERVNELLRSDISEILQREVKDPRLGVLFSVTEVEVAHDLKSARVYVSVMAGEDERENAFRALKAATPFVRRELRRRLTSLRYTPELTFLRDESIERGAHLSELIHQVEREHSEPLG
ncbi:MAG: 30S ribosome-binding factor RbfA [Dehalococcoidia bacterium]